MSSGNSTASVQSPSAAAAQLTIARQSYAAAVVACVTYGMYAVLAGICLHFLLKHAKRTTGHYVTLTYTVLMLLVSIVYFACGCLWSEIEFVESPVNPGTYATLTANSHLTIAKNVAYTVLIFLADSLILYRTYVIWQNNLFIVIIPGLMYLASVVNGVAKSIVSARPDSAFGQHLFVIYGTSFWSISVALNVLTTLLIAGKLLYHQREMSRLGQPSKYLSLVAICVESAAIYSISGLVYIPLFALNLPHQYAFSALVGSATMIAPTLIVLRIALGVAVKENYATEQADRTEGSMAFGVPTRHTHTSHSSSSRTHNASWGGSKSQATLPAHTVELHPMASEPTLTKAENI